MKKTGRHRTRYARQLLYLLPRVSVPAILGLCLGGGCGNEDRTVYADFVDIPSEGWSRFEFCEFNTAETDPALFADSAARQDMLLTVRHTDRDPYRLLLMPMTQSENARNLLPDTLRIRLTDSDGDWLGTESKGIYTYTDTLARRVPLPPLYSLRLYQAMPLENLPGLLSVGLIIQKSEN